MIAVIQAYQFLPPFTGGHRAGFAFCEGLHQQSTMICLSTTNNDADAATFPTKFLFEDVKSKYLSAQVRKAIVQECLDLGVKTLVLIQPFMAPLLFRALRKHNIKIAIYIQNIEYQRFKSMGKVWWPALYLTERWAMDFADHLLFISDDDLAEAKLRFNLPDHKLISTPYMVSPPPNPQSKQSNRHQVRQKLGIDDQVKLLYFYAPMDYLPNEKGLLFLLEQLVPLLIQKDEQFLLILSGKNLSEEATRLIEQYPEHVKWLGFVDNFQAHLHATDIMLNPIWLGGGVKIKLMEALANGVTAISFRSGALGIDRQSAGSKLQIVKDQNVEEMADRICSLTTANTSQASPDQFYEKYQTQYVIQRFLAAIQ